VLQPIELVAEICRRYRARLHVDAVQAFGKIDPAAWRCADSVAVAAHKIRGPKAVGALVGGPGFVPTPVLRGGAQERGFRPGTLDAIALCGFRVAVAHARRGPARYARLQPLRDWLERQLLDRVEINGGEAPRLPHVSNLSVRGWKGDELVAALDLLGVRISSGSACSAGTPEPSEVIAAMLGKDRAISAVRISLGDETTRPDLERALSALRRVLGVHSSSASGEA
jgi:cysteine desulfurase